MRDLTRVAGKVELQTVISIRKYRRGDARRAAALISETYARFNRGEGTEQAVRDYLASYRPEGKSSEALHARFSRTPLCFLAVAGSETVGIARGVENRLVNLYVDGGFHRRGVATRLLERYERACLRAGFSEVVLRSSIHAIPFYESRGYRKTTGLRNFHGLRVQPMKKLLARRSPR